jgi:glycosyltransferase involved in cell wall biosynthesis
MSSRYEGISIALLEAMRSGLPAVVTDVGGMPETVIAGKTGLLVASGDVAGFAEAMQRLADSAELRREFGQAAAQYQQREFSLDAMLSRYADLYVDSPTAAG